MEQHGQNSVHNSQRSATHPHDENPSQTANREPQNVPSSRTPDEPTENLEYYRGFLDRLLDCVSKGDPVDVAQLVSVIRSGASHDMILAAMSLVEGQNGHSGQNGYTDTHDQNKDNES